MDYPIVFEHTCKFPFSQVRVRATSDGAYIKTFLCLTNEEVEFSELKFTDRMQIRSLVSDWVQYFIDMKEMYENAPAPETGITDAEAERNQSSVIEEKRF